jgi:uncharacterized protein (DUF58 family)
VSVLRLIELVRTRLAMITRLGWGFLAAALILWVIGSAFGWGELRVAGAGLAVLVGFSALLTMGGMALRLQVDLTPVRVRPGQSSDGILVAANDGPRRVRSATLELPVGRTVATFTVPALAPGQSRGFDFDVATVRRGVITVGPVTTVRGDPFGLARREVSWAEAVELFVHPEVVGLPSLDAGLVRDLEGRPTSDPSASDLDFHTLRPYVPGDERRHIHWRSSARASAARGSTTFLMKGYTDTRRSHLGVIFDGRPQTYADEEAFETGVVSAASVAVRALRDEMDVTVVAADHAMDRVGVARTLDGFSRVEPSTASLPDLTARLVTLAPATSIVLVVTGAEHPFSGLRRATAQFGPHVRVVVLRVNPGHPTSSAALHGMTVLSMAELADLPRLVAVAGLA